MTGDLALLAERRAGLAALLGLLIVEEPTPALAQLVGDHPTLAPLASGDPALGVEYERLFLRRVQLYESIFVANDGQHGGDQLNAVLDTYERVGYTEHRDRAWRIHGADHLGVELRCYAHLCHQESIAWRTDTPDAAMEAVESEREFLAMHLAAWAPVALEAALRSADDGPYHEVLRAIDEFLAAEVERLRPAPDLGHSIDIDPLPERFGAARLARLLLAPAASGTFLDRHDIGAAAERIGSPWRPSDTRASLRFVLQAADDSGDIAAALQPIIEALTRDQNSWRRHALDRPGGAHHSLTWAARAHAMLALLESIAARNSILDGIEPHAESIVIESSDERRLLERVDQLIAELRSEGFHVDRKPYA